jgi:hypothetical protein
MVGVLERARYDVVTSVAVRHVHLEIEERMKVQMKDSSLNVAF